MDKKVRNNIAMKIMITRPKEQMLGLVHSLEATGNLTILAPLIRIEHLKLVPNDLKQFIDWSNIIIFTSQNTILPTIGRIKDLEIFDEKKIFAIGRKTRERLLAKKIGQVSIPKSTNSTEGLLTLNELSQFHIGNKNILIVKGQGGRKKLGHNLLKRGANLKYIDSYQRKETNISISRVLQAEDIKTPDLIIITSGSILLSLVKKIKSENLNALFSTPLLVVSQRLAKIARRLGFNGAIRTSENANDESILDSIKYWG